MKAPGIVIVGGSYAGLNAAMAARNAGYTAAITLIGEESHLPYQRPPLSKDFLRGDLDTAQLPLRPASYFETAGIAVRTGTCVESIDRGAKIVRFSEGGTLSYDKLILATGCTPRLLEVEGGDAAGIHYLRTLDDALGIAAQLGSVNAVAVVGGGFIGLEITASLRRMGKMVSVIEAQPRLLARTLSPEIADYIADWHRREGVQLRFDAQLARIHSANGRVTGVEFADGDVVPADLVIVGIGVLPNMALAQEADLQCANGIVVDEACRSSDPDIYAAGDCTWHPNAYAGGMMRLECVQNAIDQGKIAGANAAGRQVSYDVPPWYWSDQYEVKLQGVGIAAGHDHVVIRGNMEDHAFSAFYFAGEKLLAVESVNLPGEHMLARKLLASNARLTARQAADTAYDLRQAIVK